MNGGLLWVFIAAPAAVLAAWLYLTTFDIQHDDYKVQQVQVQADKAQFNSEFAEALGKPNPALDKQAQDSSREPDADWTHKNDIPSSRLCLQTYLPYWRAKWTRQWRESKSADLQGKFKAIVNFRLNDGSMAPARSRVAWPDRGERELPNVLSLCTLQF